MRGCRRDFFLYIGFLKEPWEPDVPSVPSRIREIIVFAGSRCSRTQREHVSKLARRRCSSWRRKGTRARDVRCAEVSTILETQFNNDAHTMDWNEANNCAGVSAKVCWNDEAPTGVVQSDGGKTSLYRARCANNETPIAPSISSGEPAKLIPALTASTLCGDGLGLHCEVECCEISWTELRVSGSQPRTPICSRVCSSETHTPIPSVASGSNMSACLIVLELGCLKGDGARNVQRVVQNTSVVPSHCAFSQYFNLVDVFFICVGTRNERSDRLAVARN